MPTLRRLHGPLRPEGESVEPSLVMRTDKDLEWSGCLVHWGGHGGDDVGRRSVVGDVYPTTTVVDPDLNCFLTF